MNKFILQLKLKFSTEQVWKNHDHIMPCYLLFELKDTAVRPHLQGNLCLSAGLLAQQHPLLHSLPILCKPPVS